MTIHEVWSTGYNGEVIVDITYPSGKKKRIRAENADAMVEYMRELNEYKAEKRRKQMEKQR